jgi:hypothetical protein
MRKKQEQELTPLSEFREFKQNKSLSIRIAVPILPIELERQAEK